MIPLLSLLPQLNDYLNHWCRDPLTVKVTKFKLVCSKDMSCLVLPCSALVVVCWLLIIKMLFLKSARCDTLTLWFGSRASWYRQGSQPGHFTAGEMLLKILITLVLIVPPVFLNENVSRRKLIRRKKHFSHEEKINENENPFFPGKQMIFVSFNNIFL